MDAADQRQSGEIGPADPDQTATAPAVAAAIAAAIAGTVAAASAEREAQGLPQLWREPLSAWADAADPRFADLRRIAAPDHLLPEELLSGARRVVAFFVPFHRNVVLSNKDGPEASRLWAEAYIATNALIARASDAAAAVLRREGYQAATVQATHNFDESTLMSRWSHRHIAWIARLGDFGLNNMLITARGSAGRFGSFVTDVPVEDLDTGDGHGVPGAARAGSGAGCHGVAAAGPRNGDARRPDHPCLYLRDGSCGLCVARCPTGALRPDGFDRKACYALCLKNAELHADLGLADVCGKCLSGVPCAFRE